MADMISLAELMSLEGRQFDEKPSANDIITREIQDYIAHIGNENSGRYPRGSGENPYQHEDFFLKRIDRAKKGGFTETPENIRKYFNMSTTQYRAAKSIAVQDLRRYNISTAKSMHERGMNPTEIGKKMGESESTVRGWLTADAESKRKGARATADIIKNAVDTKGPVDVGKGVELQLGVTPEKLKQALTLLQEEGYVVQKFRSPNVTAIQGKPKIYSNDVTGDQVMIGSGQKNFTNMVIMPPGTLLSEAYKFRTGEMNIHSIEDYYSRDGGASFDVVKYPASVDSKRIKIRYADEGGLDRDGLIEIRPGSPDLSLGNSKYAQVRILVDGRKYIKGMAVYNPDLPEGTDILVNSNKTKAQGFEKALKDIKHEDPNDPFSAGLSAKGQSTYVDPKTGETKLSAINKLREEGDWSDWADALPAQFLSKQSKELAKQQLTIKMKDALSEYDEIAHLTNPTIKKFYLEKFADTCDGQAVHLKAAALPGQKYHTLIPINSLKDDEVYAPRYPEGTKLALIRYPHGGIFEIPMLTVTHKNRDAEKFLGKDSLDAVGINHNVAGILSGADFDGDTVMCIPATDAKGRQFIQNKKPLQGLVGYEPKELYASTMKQDADGTKHYYNKYGVEFKPMTRTQMEMGMITNLITDMTIKQAPWDEIEKAVKHSMTVIDAEKHKLDYRQSYIENDIRELKMKWQDGGSVDTLLTKAKHETSVVRRRGEGHLNVPESPYYDPTRPLGTLIYNEVPDAHYSFDKVDPKTGRVTHVEGTKMQKSVMMAETDDARTLLSDNPGPMELLYADYANKQKKLANKARLAAYETEARKVSPEAKEMYAAEVKSLKDKLAVAEMNAPKERMAQLRANAEVNRMVLANPDMSTSAIKKAADKALKRQRAEVSAESRKTRNIDITDREWEAIQSGAIADSTLRRILNNTDADKLRERAMPRETTKLSAAKIALIKAYMNSSANYSPAAIADRLGVSVSTIENVMRKE